MKGLLRAAVLSWTTLWAVSGAAQPAAWKPATPVELIAPSAPGGGTDTTARLIQKIWQDQRMLDVPVAVVNKSGGGGALALTYLRTHASDPHFLQIVSAVLLTNHIAGRNQLGHADFTPIAILNSEYVVLAVKNDSRWRSVKDLMDALKPDPGAVSFAVGTSPGGVNHIAAAAVARAAGADPRRLKAVVFKSSAESAAAALGGHVDVMASSASLVLPHLRSGTMRILAVSAPRRLAGDLAEVPTLKEQGIDIVVDNFRLTIAPPGIGQAPVAYWDQVMLRLSVTDEWKQDLERNGWENTYMNSRDTANYLDVQYLGLKGVLIEAGFAK
jgi:putative tricarboxylic transport membrane protein